MSSVAAGRGSQSQVSSTIPLRTALNMFNKLNLFVAVDTKDNSYQ
ncbi:hypothetical protein PC110_g4535 [Phytophthora cactorum]|uniref:Uncharacterized protein n=1 Tax=Phytophthora cactorum TaxID=29920 RepID=A0A329SRT3_9STRA|nr:hypothetical protein PC110_g4535 [Phytophthora cactorum]